MMSEEETYNMSFTAGAAMLSETRTVAEALIEHNGDWTKVRDLVLVDNILQKEKKSSNNRYFVLMKQRLSALNQEELNMFVNSSVAVQRYLILLAICKAHPFVFDFINETVRYCYYNQYEKLTKANFNEFFNEKKYEHPELEKVTPLTVGKMRQVIFRILEQTELIEDIETGMLRRPYLPEEVERIIINDDPKYLAAFLYSNNEISNLISLYS